MWILASGAEKADAVALALAGSELRPGPGGYGSRAPADAVPGRPGGAARLPRRARPDLVTRRQRAFRGTSADGAWLGSRHAPISRPATLRQAGLRPRADVTTLSCAGATPGPPAGGGADRPVRRAGHGDHLAADRGYGPRAGPAARRPIIERAEPDRGALLRPTWASPRPGPAGPRRPRQLSRGPARPGDQPRPAAGHLHLQHRARRPDPDLLRRLRGPVGVGHGRPGLRRRGPRRAWRPAMSGCRAGPCTWPGARTSVGSDIVCGLAVYSDASQPDPAACSKPTRPAAWCWPWPAARRGDPLARQRRHPLRASGRLARSLAGNRLGIAFLGLVGVLAAGFALLATARGTSVGDALYLTLLDAAGTTSPDQKMPLPVKVAQFLLTFDGLAVLPLITAAVVGARLTGSASGAERPVSDHVIVANLGNVGTRVAGLLHDLGVDVVCVDKSETASGLAMARRLGLKVVIGETHREETLRAAGIDELPGPGLGDQQRHREPGNGAACPGAGRRRSASSSGCTTTTWPGASRRRSATPCPAPFLPGRPGLRGRDPGSSGPPDHRGGTACPGHRRRARRRRVGAGRWAVRDVHERGTVRVIALRTRGAERVDWAPRQDYQLMAQDRYTCWPRGPG